MRAGTISRKNIFPALVAIFLLLAPYLFATVALCQTLPPPPGQDTGIDPGSSDLSPGAQRTQNTVPRQPYTDARGQTTLVQQAAEQDTQQVIDNTTWNLLNNNSELGAYNETYLGIKAFWSDDVVSNFFANVGQVLGRWLTEWINGWVSDIVQYLAAFLRTFVLNPNIAVNGSQNSPGGGGNDDISPWIRQGADVMYGIAVDLLLLLFILCIWKYWTDAAWRGGVGLMGSVGRLIATAGLMLAWPTIYAFEIQITNEMIKAIYFNSSSQVTQLDAALAVTVKAGLVATAALLTNVFAPVVGSVAGGAAGGGAGGLVLNTVGGVVSFAGLVIYLILGGILIGELVYILVLKSIQTALLTAQYMFAPIFLVFFATPDTENVTSGFVKSWVEVSLWTFVWVGLLKIFVIMIFSNFNPWGKLIMAVGILQLMIQVPSFLARAQISPMSDFISAGLITGGLLKGTTALGSALKFRIGQGFDYMFNQQYAARGLAQSQKVPLNNLPSHAADPQLRESLKSAQPGQPIPGGPTPPGGAGGAGGAGSRTLSGQPPPLTVPQGQKGQQGKSGTGAQAGQPGGDPKKLNVPQPGKPGETVPPAAKLAGAKPGDGTGLPGAKPGQDPLATGRKLTGAGPGALAAAGQPGQPGLTGARPGQTGDSALTQQPTGADAAQVGGALKTAAAVGLAAATAGSAMAASANQQREGDKEAQLRRQQAAREVEMERLAQQAANLQTLAGEQEKDKGKDKDKEDKAKLGAAAGVPQLKPGVKGAPPPMPLPTAGATGATGVAPPKLEVTADGTRKLTGAGAGTAGAGGEQAIPGKVDVATGSADTKKAGALGAGGVGAGATAGAAGATLRTGLEAGQQTGVGVKPTVPPLGAGQPGAQELKVPGEEQELRGEEQQRGAQPGAGATVTPQVVLRPGQAPTIGAPLAERGVPPPGLAGATQRTPSGQQGSDGSPAAVPLPKPGVPEIKTGAPLPGAAGKVGLAPPAVPNLGGTPISGVDGRGLKVKGTGTDLGPGGQQLGVSEVEVPTEEDGALHRTAADGRQVVITARPAGQAAQAGQPLAHAQAGGPLVGGPVAGVVPPPPAIASPTPGLPATMVRPPGQSNLAAASHMGTPAQLAQMLHAGAVNQGRTIDPMTGQVPAELQGNFDDGGGAAGGPSGPPPGGPVVSPFDKYKQAGYRWVAPRGLAIDIRTAQGPTMGPNPDGNPVIVGDAKGHIGHVRWGRNATEEQKALQVIAGGYAQTFSSDAEAFDAARQSAIDAGEDQPQTLMERMGAGFMAAEGKSFKQTAVAKQRFQRSLFKHAVLGSEAYVANQSGNAFTEYLRTRYGDMTPEQQAWGIHIFTDDSSPESGWSPKVSPATETLLSQGIPITADARAAAANPAVLKQPAWGRGHAIRGVRAYSLALAESQTGPDTHPMVKDALIGRIAPNISAAQVGAAMAIVAEAPTPEAGEQMIMQNPGMVTSVAHLVSAGQARDYVSAVRMMSTVMNVAERSGPAAVTTRSGMDFGPGGQPPTSGGGPFGGGGSPGIGPGPGHGPGHGPAADHIVDATYNPGAPASAGVPLPPPMPSGPLGFGHVPGQTNVTFNTQGLAGGGVAPTTHRSSMEMPLQSGQAGSVGDVRMAGGAPGLSGPTVQQDVDLGVSGRLVPPAMPAPNINPGAIAGGGVQHNVNARLEPGATGVGPTQRLNAEGHVLPGGAADVRTAGVSTGGAGPLHQQDVDVSVAGRVQPPVAGGGIPTIQGGGVFTGGGLQQNVNTRIDPSGAGGVSSQRVSAELQGAGSGATDVRMGAQQVGAAPLHQQDVDVSVAGKVVPPVAGGGVPTIQGGSVFTGGGLQQNVNTRIDPSGGGGVSSQRVSAELQGTGSGATDVRMGGVQQVGAAPLHQQDVDVSVAGRVQPPVAGGGIPTIQGGGVFTGGGLQQNVNTRIDPSGAGGVSSQRVSAEIQGTGSGTTDVRMGGVQQAGAAPLQQQDVDVSVTGRMQPPVAGGVPTIQGGGVFTGGGLQQNVNTRIDPSGAGGVSSQRVSAEIQGTGSGTTDVRMGGVQQVGAAPLQQQDVDVSVTSRVQPPVASGPAPIIASAGGLTGGGVQQTVHARIEPGSAPTASRQTASMDVHGGAGGGVVDTRMGQVVQPGALPVQQQDIDVSVRAVPSTPGGAAPTIPTTGSVFTGGGVQQTVHARIEPSQGSAVPVQRASTTMDVSGGPVDVRLGGTTHAAAAPVHQDVELSVSGKVVPPQHTPTINPGTIQAPGVHQRIDVSVDRLSESAAPVRQTVDAALTGSSGGTADVHIAGSQGSARIEQVQLDVQARLAGGGQKPVLPPLPPLSQSSGVRVDVNIVSGNEGATTSRQSMDAPVSSAPGAEDVRLQGAPGSSGSAVHHTQVDVYARAVGGGHTPGVKPLVPPLQQQQQQVREQIDINIHPDARPTAGGTVERLVMDAPVETQAVSGPTDVRVSGGGSGGSQTITNQQVVDVHQRATGGGGGSMSSGEVARMAQNEAMHGMQRVHMAQQIIMEMKAAGFSDDQIQNQGIAQTAYEVYQHDSSMLPTAALTARVMGTRDFNTQTVHVVQQMIDAGFNTNNISRPDVITAQAIIQAHHDHPEYGTAYPTPDYVRQVRMDTRFYPRPGASIDRSNAMDIVAERARRRDQGEIDGHVRRHVDRDRT